MHRGTQKKDTWAILKNRKYQTEARRSETERFFQIPLENRQEKRETVTWTPSGLIMNVNTIILLHPRVYDKYSLLMRTSAAPRFLRQSLVVINPRPSHLLYSCFFYGFALTKKIFYSHTWARRMKLCVCKPMYKLVQYGCESKYQRVDTCVSQREDLLIFCAYFFMCTIIYASARACHSGY